MLSNSHSERSLGEEVQDLASNVSVQPETLNRHGNQQQSDGWDPELSCILELQKCSVLSRSSFSINFSEGFITSEVKAGDNQVLLRIVDKIKI